MILPAKIQILSERKTFNFNIYVRYRFRGQKVMLDGVQKFQYLWQVAALLHQNRPSIQLINVLH